MDKNKKNKNSIKINKSSDEKGVQSKIIQWFPGHMAKTRRLIKEQLKLVDAVTIILDARIPRSSLNPEINELTDGKPKIVLFNKADSADENSTKKWMEYYKNEGCAVLAIDCKTGRGLNQFRSLVRDVLKDKIKQNEDKGMAGKTLRIMVIGVPNTGKSTFINKMGAGNKAKAEDRAGVTRRTEWFVIGGGIEMLDTPGVLWPKFEDPKVGDRLAFTGGIKDDILDMETVVCRFLDVMKKEYPDRLAERYKIENFENLESYEILELIGIKRGFLMGGGVVNTERTSVCILDEYRAGLLGRITLELPEENLK